MTTCFVVQGYGKKTDYTDGRVLDLDASYEIIKEAVESEGIQCIRADEIIHSGTIDVPMYERLLNADLVIADLSTYNVNAAFELGVRYALKPYSTIVLAEEQFKNPFDLGHIVLRRYKHLGDEVGFKEAKRLMAELKSVIQVMLTSPTTDSPVYTFLPQLRPPQVPRMAAPSSSLQFAAVCAKAAPSDVADILGDDNPDAKVMLDTALEKINGSNFSEARILLEEVKKLRKNDSFVLQQLALATYKSKQPSIIEALQDARSILQGLAPEISNNPETLGLWGAVHKRMWEEQGVSQYLDESISAYERGFYIKQDHYNGINLAYLLTLRSVEKLKHNDKDEAIADCVLARRVRKDVIRYATPLVAHAETEEEKSLDESKKKEAENKRYWVLATLWEAAIGLGDDAAALKWAQALDKVKVADWMQDSRIVQGGKLQSLLAKYAELISKEK